ncbi:MAG TPA: nicotinate-nicotinamide nucleotide adenylyltransferase, partial [Thermoanaerobaculia bacterium]|nr:nicotinate-nicotinamide nucleotide adenylyltransferase [Thermoanaerobaculia bacterium]
PLELERGETSYTVDTLQILRHLHPTDTLDWIIGEDNLAVLMSWKEPARILELANFVVLKRGGGASTPPELAGCVKSAAERGKQGAIVLADNIRVDISATEIRNRVREGRAFTDLVTPEVARYVERYDLYRPEEMH